MIRSIHTFTLDELRLIARDLADSGEECSHPFEAGSEEANWFDRAFNERMAEMRPAKETT